MEELPPLRVASSPVVKRFPQQQFVLHVNMTQSRRHT